MLKTDQSAVSRIGVQTLWLTAALAVPILTSNAALADEICGDTTCGRGFVCQSYEMGWCSAPTRDYPTSPVIAGGAGSEAQSAPVGGAASGDDSNVEPVCESNTVYECVPAPCTADTDCADGMVCHTYTNETCSGSDMPPCKVDDPECISEPVTPAECTTSTTQQCVARYQLPCSTASDCGPGFTCEEQQSCWCSGSAPRSGTGVGGTAATDDPAASSDGSSDADVEPGDASVDPPDCGCTPTGTFACQLQTIACNADADCPSGLVCVENPSGSCWMSSDGTSGCTTPDPAKVCQPRYYGGSAGGGVGEDGAPSAGGGQASTPPTGTVGTPIVDTSDDDDVDGNDDPGVVHPGGPGQHPHHFGGFGCALANASNTSPSGLSTLLFGVGVALGMRRRRARR